ncbi:pre-rRNA-processing protein TSR1 homolog [Xenopus laevis]|uniref:Pre-rRNA-processing protein TSR1 homolog n=1 Tax=Xenopus laevis TaxID=8355 RepID=TSR1_XENLA|nr:pre-rRNA-processing protein TSR1 homolog [Xenopus laevis]Q5XGY1.1 RecName: Full=Pre-rRNA-processing protein TSR1 homolog [Xenopus laevis]AAH84296.1 LOC495115 protein [Xenopus laevis]
MAAGEQQAAHRPGAYKQQNKPHKSGRHRGRGAQDRENKGRVAAKILGKKNKKDLRKLDRRHKANQIRRQRKDAVLAEKRSLGTKDGPPHLVIAISLHARAVKDDLFSLVQNNEGDILHVNDQIKGLLALVCPKVKQRWCFIQANRDDLCSLLDLAKVADTLLFLLDPQEGWDSYGDYCLSCLFAQGLPSYVLAVQGMNYIPIKKRADIKKQLSKVIENRFTDAKLFQLDTEQEAAVLIRQISTQKQRHLAFRSRRSYMLAQRADFQPTDESGLVGTLKLSGYVRGQELNVNRLVHIVGHGDFHMSQIDAPPDPYPLNPRVHKPKTKSGQDMEMSDEPATGSEMEQDIKVLMKADPSAQESLQCEVVPDPMEGEQTWPTEEELKEAEDALKGTSKVVKKVPKGTSAYQAAWILDDEGDGEEESDDDDDEDMEEDAEDAMDDAYSEEEDGSGNEEAEESETLTIPDSTRDDKYDENVDEQEEEQMLEKYKLQRQDEVFPDEVDTPRDQIARIRFQKYRGLKSFRTSPWDVKENLPRDYARIFQFHDFFRTRKRVFKEEEEKDEGAMVGWYVTVHISAVPVSVMEHFKHGLPLVLCSLLPHEQKMSVMNMLVRRHPGNNEPIKAKEELIFHCGFRRFRASPLFSQHSSADKHKSERFLRSDTSVVVTVYAPITFPPASVLVFKQRYNGMQDLVATGSLLNVNPDRIVIKRIVLSGHPFKIMKRTAVVRYMFFNREDVLWFKPVELRTKWGRRGHIKEPLGTHGHMKCHFDGQLKSQDTVLMNLYKRVYPKWTFDPYVPRPVTWVKNENTVDITEVEMD